MPTVTENKVLHETETQYVTATDQVTVTEVYTIPTTIISSMLLLFSVKVRVTH